MSEEAAQAARYRFQHEWPVRLRTELSDPSTHAPLLPNNFQICPFHYHHRESLLPVHDFVKAIGANFVPASSKELEAIASQVGLSAEERLKQTHSYRALEVMLTELEQKAGTRKTGV